MNIPGFICDICKTRYEGIEASLNKQKVELRIHNTVNFSGIEVEEACEKCRNYLASHLMSAITSIVEGFPTEVANTEDAKG